MTPPDNTEGRAPSGTADAGVGDVAPPWQRVARDGGSAGQDNGDGRWSAVVPPAGGVAPPGQAAGGLAEPGVPHNPANRFFEYQDARQQPAASPQAHTVSALRRPGRGPRRASLQIKRFDPWSVLKLSLVLGVALFLVWLVAVGVLYTVLDGMGVWDKLNGTYSSLVQGDSPEGVEPLISVGRVFGVAAVVGAINIVLISALTTVCAFIYNASADLAGGLEVTLSERD